MITYVLCALLSSLFIAPNDAPGYTDFTFLQRSLPASPNDTALYQSENLIIRRITPHVFQHISYLKTTDFGKVPCNGMVVVNDREAVIFDTPSDTTSSEELIKYLQKETGAKIKAVLATHFHEDCVGGLKAFHDHGIPSFSNERTIALLKSKRPDAIQPQNGFEDRLELEVGNKKVLAVYPGEGHTKDNCVGYFAEEHILFGGCLIKEVGATKGNLADANTRAWPATVQKVRALFPNLRLVVPGHGKPGGPELLDYTAKLFE